MDSMELKNYVCRVCLEQKAILDWSDEILEFCGVTYKDCYYKYTQLKLLVVDPYSQMLCQICSEELKTSHSLVMKALESHAVLQQRYLTETKIICSSENEETKEKFESFQDHQKYEPKYEPDEFEMLIFKQNEEPLIEENNDNDDDDKEFNTISKIETYEDYQEKGRKRRYNRKAKSTKKDYSPSSSQEEISINSKSKKIKPLSGEDSDEQEFVSIINDETLKISKKSKQKRQIKAKKEKVSVKINENEMKTDESPNIPNDDTKDKKIYSKKKLMCSICSKIYSGKTSLLRHEESHNEHRERLEVCPHCGIKFFNKRCLYLHLKIHNKNREKKYKCEFCNKAYFNMGALNVHRRIHLGQMVPCPICSKEFHRQVDLDRHNIVAHSEAPLTTDIKKKSKYYVFCKDCNKHLLTTSWKAHQAAHLKEPLMKCSICEKDFFNRDTCRYHMQKVHNYKTREEYEQFIIYCKPNRLSHLLLEQHDIIQSMKK